MRQIEPETTAWYLKWSGAQDTLRAGLNDRDLSSVPTRPYKDEPVGETGFPVSNQMEDKLFQAYQDSTDITIDPQIGIELQVNTLESFRRANLSRRQTRRELLAHFIYELGQAPRQNSLMLQTMAGTAKIPKQPSDA